MKCTFACLGFSTKYCRHLGFIRLGYNRVQVTSKKNESTISEKRFISSLSKTCQLNLRLGKTAYLSSQANFNQGHNWYSRSRTVHNQPSFKDFLQKASTEATISNHDISTDGDEHYLSSNLFNGSNKKVFIETYGCQMNVNDTEIAWSILRKNGFKKAVGIDDADVILLVTCSIREGAEDKIWKRLRHFKSIKQNRDLPLKIGLLGCMAERLKHKIVEKEQIVDVVCGPDAYRDLPRLLTETEESHQAAVNVQLSLEETYADVIPVRINSNSTTAFVSIMRGCDNMCSYCIVPFTRGRERSRPISSILHEVEHLSTQGVKEVTLLGQNVNSYRDLCDRQNDDTFVTKLSAGFSTVYRPKVGGLRFASLLKAVSNLDPEMRIRFTSPHPKDFPDEVLQVIQESPNVCSSIHLPAQSGNNEVLRAMGRGYTRENYLELVEKIRNQIPNVALSSDFIAGFCGETDAAHKDTLTLLEEVEYNFTFCFPYSMRQKTRAYHRLQDDVCPEVKKSRHLQLNETWRRIADKKNKQFIGSQQLILVEGPSKRSPSEFYGRTDGNTKVIFPNVSIASTNSCEDNRVSRAGDYVVAQIESASSQTMKGHVLYRTTLTEYRDKTSDVNTSAQKVAY